MKSKINTGGMDAILVIDSLSSKNTASGGTRFAHKSTDDALFDAVRLARAMTKKAKVLGVNEGGAKAIVLAKHKKTKKFLEGVGNFIELQNGLFRTAVDLGFNLKEAKTISSKTQFIDSLSHSYGGLGSTGENTAEGMVHGFNIICKEILKKPIKESSIAVQGLGAVGMILTKKLCKKGCKVIVADINKTLCDKAEKLGAEIVSPSAIFSQEADIFSPCAIGAVLNKKTIPKLKCKIVAGGANNILKDEKKGERQLLDKGIIFVPDFVLNCAGFLQALIERKGGNVKDARKKSNIIAKKLSEIIHFSRENKCTLLESANKIFGVKNEN